MKCQKYAELRNLVWETIFITKEIKLTVSIWLLKGLLRSDQIIKLSIKLTRRKGRSILIRFESVDFMKKNILEQAKYWSMIIRSYDRIVLLQFQIMWNCCTWVDITFEYHFQTFYDLIRSKRLFKKLFNRLSFWRFESLKSLRKWRMNSWFINGVIQGSLVSLKQKVRDCSLLLKIQWSMRKKSL